MKESEKIPNRSFENPRLQGGWLTSLLDFQFKRLMTPSTVKAIYFLSLVMVLLGTLTWVFNAEAFGSFFWRVLTSPVVLILGFLLTRMAMELVIAFFRLLETQRNIEDLLREQLGKPPRKDEL